MKWIQRFRARWKAEKARRERMRVSVGGFTTFREVVVPLMMPSLAAGWIYIFLLAMKELSVALMLYSPGSRILATLIFDQYQAGRYNEMAAFGISVTAILGLVALVFHRLSARYGVASRES